MEPNVETDYFCEPPGPTPQLSPSALSASALSASGAAPSLKPYLNSPYWECQNPVTITVKDLVYAVPDKELLPGCNTTCGIGSKNSKDLQGKKILLDHVNMIARPGELLAIIGPSGGGKTTLLNVLAMRSPSWRVPSGHAKFNGKSETKDSVKSTVNYVMAHDKLLPYLTVYETLVSAADLKLPHLSKEERRLRAQAVLEDMALERCRDTYIGGEWRKGVSTGELKRVAIGIELLDEPSVLILDEPTSGLDSTLSVKIMELLLKEARKGRTVITTVHQPSSQVFEMFDCFLLISHGHIVYHGAADQALHHFSELGYASQKDWNPSDFLLDLVSDHPASSANALEDGMSGGRESEGTEMAHRHLDEEERLSLVEKWDSSAQNQSLMDEISNVEDGMSKVVSPKSMKSKLLSKTKSSHWFHEVAVLWKRTSRNSIRNPLTAIVTLLVMAMEGLILGGIFFHLSKVGPGPKPEPMLDIEFWNNAWVQAYNFGVDGQGNHPLVSMFEKGVDGDGSYVLGKNGTTDEEWQTPVKFILDEAVTCIYNKRQLGDTYPPLPMSATPAPKLEDWTADKIYTSVMAAYQVFDSLYNTGAHPGLDLSFFKTCKNDFGDLSAMQFYVCVMQRGKPVLDDLVTCVNMPPLPATGGRRMLDVSEIKATSAPTPAPAAERRELMSIGGSIDMNKQIQDILGDELMQLVNAADKWIDRVTSCSDPICGKFNTIKEFVSDWATGTIDTVSAVLNLSGLLFFVVSVLGFASYDALLTFPQERALFNREAANGLYRPSSYYLAKNLADLPFQLLPSLVMATILYLMVGFDLTASQYFTYFAICVLTCFCAYGFGYMVSAAAPRMELAILVAPLTLVIWLVLAGFFLRDGDVPAWINWFKYLSFYRWGFFSLVINQFPPGGYFGTLPNNVHLALSGVTETSLGVCAAALVALGFAYRFLGYIFLATTNRRVGLEA